MSTRKQITKHARQLRQESTFEEDAFWFKVRNRKFNGLKFNRQFPIVYTITSTHRYFVADFYCHEKKLVIELDGKIHIKTKEYDENRDTILKELGLKVLRIQNEELDDWFKLKEKILTFIENDKLQTK